MVRGGAAKAPDGQEGSGSCPAPEGTTVGQSWASSTRRLTEGDYRFRRRLRQASLPYNLEKMSGSHGARRPMGLVVCRAWSRGLSNWRAEWPGGWLRATSGAKAWRVKGGGWRGAKTGQGRPPVAWERSCGEASAWDHWCEGVSLVGW